MTRVMIISLIAAASENNVIGNHGTLPWSLPDDLKHFRTVTEGHPVIMGRKTFASIGKPLPNRKNIVITRGTMTMPGCDIVHSLEEALDLARAANAAEVFVMGGGEIYAQALPIADRVYLTRVHATIEGDAFFPELDPQEWEETEQHEHAQDEKHAYACTFTLYERRGR